MSNRNKVYKLTFYDRKVVGGKDDLTFFLWLFDWAEKKQEAGELSLTSEHPIGIYLGGNLVGKLCHPSGYLGGPVDYYDDAVLEPTGSTCEFVEGEWVLMTSSPRTKLLLEDSKLERFQMRFQWESGLLLSTVKLDSPDDDGKWYETMIFSHFDDPDKLNMGIFIESYATKEEANKGHWRTYRILNDREGLRVLIEKMDCNGPEVDFIQNTLSKLLEESSE